MIFLDETRSFSFKLNQILTLSRKLMWILDFEEIDIFIINFNLCTLAVMIISKVFEEFCSRLGHSGCETAVAEAVHNGLKKTTESLALLSYSIREEKENEVIVIKSLSGSPTIRTPFAGPSEGLKIRGEGASINMLA